MNDVSRNVKKVLIIYLIFFMILTSYISYFYIFVGPKILMRTDNQRLWAKRNEVLRGTIYDRNMKPLTESKKIDTLKQERSYTGGDIFAHVLGYVNPKYGITGLENKYDSYLMGAREQTFSEFIASKGQEKEKKGDNLVTTLDYDVQKKAFDLLGNDRGAVVALNPKTGEIIAMVSKPSFDPNNLDENWKDINSNTDRPLLNRAVSGLYPPGSTFKTITAISAIENIPDIMQENFKDNGKLVFNSSFSLNNYNGEVLGDLTFKEAYMHSSNVVFGGLGLKIGNEALKTTAEKFYFNKDIPSDGIVIDNSKFPTYKSYEKGNIAQSAIGQSGVLASPTEMCLVTSTIANDGNMMEPYLVKKIVDSDGKVVKEIQPKSLGNVISTNTANTMKDFMKAVVKGGTGTNAQLDGVVVCGKTGTADNGKGLAPHSWFIGFAPYDNPQIAVAVIVENGGQGGVRAAKIASEVMKTALLSKGGK